ncbi:MAG: entericidin EcnA/B family protein [Kiritimatiellae bacterium]|nr:entericidin EcnA/B family protein [Kiritimatiellia bacterium]
MKKFIALLVLLVMTLMLSSCNMFKGAGKDIGIAGDAIRDATN